MDDFEARSSLVRGRGVSPWHISASLGVLSYAEGRKRLDLVAYGFLGPGYAPRLGQWERLVHGIQLEWSPCTIPGITPQRRRSDRLMEGVTDNSAPCKLACPWQYPGGNAGIAEAPFGLVQDTDFSLPRLTLK